eukprot:6082382-Prymnesium_polylepis.1
MEAVGVATEGGTTAEVKEVWGEEVDNCTAPRNQHNLCRPPSSHSPSFAMPAKRASTQVHVFEQRTSEPHGSGGLGGGGGTLGGEGGGDGGGGRQRSPQSVQSVPKAQR